MNVKTIFVTTNGSGAFTYDRPFKGQVHAVTIEVGDLSTPDLDVTDSVFSTTLLSVDGVSADTAWQLGAPLVGSAGSAIDALSTGDTVGVYAAPVIAGNLTVAITGGGNAKHGTVRILFT